MGKYNNPSVDNVFASDAEWRAWCLEIQSALLASGFLNAAADTGQIDLTSAVRPAIGLFAGFKMYKANDALQATKPLFVKVEFGVGTAVTRGKLQITIGTTTNGTGTLGGQVTSALAVLSATADGSGACRVWGSGDETCAWFAQWDGTGNNTQGCCFFLSRSVLRNSKAAVNDFAVVGHVASATGTAFSLASYTIYSAAWASLTLSDVFPRPDAVPSTGGDIATVYLFDSIFYRAAQILTLPFVIGKTTELPYTDPEGGAFAINVWGASRIFTPMPWNTVGASQTGTPAFPWNA